MLTAIDSAQGDLNKAQANIEAWFNSGMDRVSGWYKRKTQWILFWIGLALAVGLNINTLTIADHLYRNETDRTELADRARRSGQPSASATVAVASTPAQTDPAPAGNSQQQAMPNAGQAVDEFEKMSLPIGWSNWSRPKNARWYSWIILAFGWLLTAFAASMGAPFWFDMLNKVTVIRSTVKPHEKSPEEGSKDHQPAAEKPANETPEEVVDAGVPGEPVAPIQPGPPPGDFPSLSDSSDAEAAIDGCDVEITEVTDDKDLPAAEGGVEE